MVFITFKTHLMTSLQYGRVFQPR